MDIDSTEIQIWTRESNGTHQMRWLPLRELMKLLEQPALDAIADHARALGELFLLPPSEAPEQS